jgi:hypothetical protein
MRNNSLRCEKPLYCSTQKAMVVHYAEVVRPGDVESAEVSARDVFSKL